MIKNKTNICRNVFYVLGKENGYLKKGGGDRLTKVYYKVFDVLCEHYINLGTTNRIGYRDKVQKIQQIYDKGYIVCYTPEEVLYTWGMTDKEIELMQEVEFA